MFFLDLLNQMATFEKNTRTILFISEKLNLDEDEKQKLLDLINFEKLSEGALLKAYEADIFPVNHVTKAALALCSKVTKWIRQCKGCDKNTRSRTQQIRTWR